MTDAANPTPEGCTPADARVLREANHALAQEVFDLKERLTRATDSLKLVQRHAVTRWAAGHRAGLAASEHSRKAAQNAVAKDAWDNTRLTECLIQTEEQRDALRSYAEQLRKALADVDKNEDYLGGDGYYREIRNEVLSGVRSALALPIPTGVKK